MSNQFDESKQVTDLEQIYLDEKQETEQSFINDMIEYQNNQFNPGYYVGTGKIPPVVKALGNALLLTIWMFIQALGIVIVYCFIIRFLFFSDSDITFEYGSPLVNFIVITVVFMLAALACLWLGIVYLKKAKSQKAAKAN